MLAPASPTPIRWSVIDRDAPDHRATVTASDVRRAKELGAVALGVPVGRVVVTAFEETGAQP